MLKDLKLNDNLIVRDNSYCYEIKTNSDGSKYLEKAYLHPEYHQNTKYPFDTLKTSLYQSCKTREPSRRMMFFFDPFSTL